MIHYKKHSEIDKKKWDACLDRSLNTLPYGYSWYLDVVCAGWEALVEDDYHAVMPLTAGKKYGTHYLYPPYFAQQLGVFSEGKLSQQKVNDFLLAIPSHYKFIEIHLNTHNTFEFSSFQAKKNTNIELSLSPSYDILRKKFSDDIKRNIKKAEKHNVEIRRDIPPSGIISIFRKNTGKKINNLGGKHYKTLLLLINTLIGKGYAETRGAFVNGKLCAGVVWVIQNGRAIFLFSGTDAIAKKTGSMHRVIDTFIKENAGKEMILDFEGSNLAGLARFYKGFGSMETVYLQVRKNNLPKLIKWIKG